MMIFTRKLGTNTFALGALLVVSSGVSGGAGCSVTKPTELVPGVTSQIVVPHDLQTVRLTVSKEGSPIPSFDACYQVGANGVVLLPSTLGVVSADAPGTTVTVAVRGYQTSQNDTGSPAYNDCTNLTVTPVGEGGPQVLRRSVQSYVEGHTLFLPMPLSYSCWNQNGCTDTETCKGNTCVPHVTDQTKLVEFDPSLVDGTGDCFDPTMCFAQAIPAVVVDAASCTYSFPAPAPLGVNVRVYYQDFTWTQLGSGVAADADGGTVASGPYEPVLGNGGEREILSLDSVEGFQLVNAADAGTASADGGAKSFAGQQLFQLAPGLCKLVQAASVPPPSPATGGAAKFITISNVEVWNACAPKLPLLPICAGEQTALNNASLPGGGTTTDGTCNVPVAMTPTESAIYLAMDQSEVMYGAFGATGSATALSVSLSDPVFKRTSAAFKFLPGQAAQTDCTATTTSFLTPDIPFALAGVVQSQLGAKLLGWTPPEVSAGTCATSADCSAGAPVCANDNCISPAPLDLQAALRLDSGAYAEVLSFLKNQEPPNTAAVMFFLNRAPSVQNDCNPLLGSQGPTSVLQAVEEEIQAAFDSSPSLRTFFVVLDDDQHDTSAATGALTFFNQVQRDLPQAVTVLDATTAKNSQQSGQTVAANFSKIVTQLGTCLYDDFSLPPSASLSEVTVKYTVPGVGPGTGDTIVPGASNCDEATQTTVNGWNIDNGRVRICGQPCSNLRSAILAATGAALAQNLPAPDIAVSATVLCGGTDAGLPVGTSTDAGATTGGADATILGFVPPPSANEDGGSAGDDSSLTEDGAVSDEASSGTPVDASALLGDAGPR